MPSPLPPHTLLMFLCGLIASGVFIKPFFIQLPCSSFVMSSLGPFITALSHFQWSCSQSANKGVNGSEAAFRKGEKEPSPAAFAGWFVTLSDKFLHLKVTRCPLSRIAIIYLNVDVQFFFSSLKRQHFFALFAFLRVAMEPQRFCFDFLLLLAFFAHPLPSSLFIPLFCFFVAFVALPAASCSSGKRRFV